MAQLGLEVQIARLLQLAHNATAPVTPRPGLLQAEQIGRTGIGHVVVEMG